MSSCSSYFKHLRYFLNEICLVFFVLQYSLGPVYVSLHAFHLGQIISTVLGYIDHGSIGGQHGICAKTRIRDETSQNDHIQKQPLRHSPIY